MIIYGKFYDHFMIINPHFMTFFERRRRKERELAKAQKLGGGAIIIKEQGKKWRLSGIKTFIYFLKTFIYNFM